MAITHYHFIACNIRVCCPFYVIIIILNDVLVIFKCEISINDKNKLIWICHIDLNFDGHSTYDYIFIVFVTQN